MDLYYTDFEDADAVRRNDARSVDAWMRAAAYAAGDDPDTVLGLAGANFALCESAQRESDLLH